MTEKHTELVFILDKSGSMAGLEEDTIGGYNAMLQKQKKEEGEARITTVLFNDEIETIYENMPIQQVGEMTANDYVVSGMTALVDAIGLTIQQVKGRRKNRHDRVLFVVTTDGMENASKEFTTEKLKEMIEQQEKEANWKFIFLGANIDAIDEAKKYGIDQDYAVNYHADEVGIQSNYEAIHEVASSFRQGKALRENWKSKIEKDFQNRSQ